VKKTQPYNLSIASRNKHASVKELCYDIFMKIL